MIHIEVITPGESLWMIANRYGVSIDDIMKANQLKNPGQLVPGQSIIVETAGRTHIVQPGETLWEIASRYKVSLPSLLQINHITNAAVIHPGATLILPQRTRRTIDSNAYLQPTNTAQDRTLVTRFTEDLTFISMFQYRTTRTGEIIAPPAEIALSATSETSSVPMLVLSNFEEGNFSPEIARAVFTVPAAQERLISSVIKTMKEKGYYALNIDFENLFPNDRERYNTFLREITRQVKAAGFLISTALAPKTSAEQKGAWYEAHDYAAHGQIVDFVIIMTYEWGWSGGPPMAVAPIPQVRQVLDYAVTAIPHSKIMMGAPLYGYDWTLPFVQGGKFARALSPQTAVEQAWTVGANIQFDQRSMAPFYHYYDRDAKEHVVWFEDARSMQAKFELIEEYGLLGISYWVLGHEFPQNWALLRDHFNIRKLR